LDAVQPEPRGQRAWGRRTAHITAQIHLAPLHRLRGCPKATRVPRHTVHHIWDTRHIVPGNNVSDPALGWIRNLQRDLTKLHLYTGPITGVETPATKTAVIHFQRASHLKPDGLWGTKSQVALDKMLHRR
jgi:Putative peptidoglycan binding domain